MTSSHSFLRKKKNWDLFGRCLWAVTKVNWSVQWSSVLRAIAECIFSREIQVNIDQFNFTKKYSLFTVCMCETYPILFGIKYLTIAFFSSSHCIFAEKLGFSKSWITCFVLTNRSIFSYVKYTVIWREWHHIITECLNIGANRDSLSSLIMQMVMARCCLLNSRKPNIRFLIEKTTNFSRFLKRL